MLHDPLGLTVSVAESCGEIARMRFGFTPAFLLNRTEYLEQVFGRPRLYRRSHIYQRLSPLLGKALFTLNGKEWREQRAVVQPAFMPRRVRNLVGAMAECAEGFSRRWREIPDGGQIDLSREMMKIALDVAGVTLMSVSLRENEASVSAALGTALEELAHRAHSPFVCPVFLPTTARNRRLRRAIAALDVVVNGIIAERRRRNEDTGDVLSILLAHRDAEGGRLTEKQIHDHVMTFILAGHETTANALTWTLKLLAEHPWAYARVVEEVDRVIGSGPVTEDALGGLRFTEMALKESMRLYPPVWMIDRVATEADVLSHGENGIEVRYAIPKGSFILISPFLIQHNPRYWPDPYRFDPERFGPGAAGRPMLSYIPFGFGSNICIGKDFALQEAKIALATLTRDYLLELVPGQTIVPRPRLTLRPDPAVLMRIRRRR